MEVAGLDEQESYLPRILNLILPLKPQLRALWCYQPQPQPMEEDEHGKGQHLPTTLVEGRRGGRR